MLAFVIIFLFLGASVVSSNDNFLKDTPVDCPKNFLKEIPSDYSPLESVYSSEGKFSDDITWCLFMYGIEGYGFYIFYQNDTYRFRKWEGDGFFSGGTWTNDGRWLCCMYENGTIYDIDIETLEPCAIGDGGTGLNALSYDPLTNRLFGVSSHYPSFDRLWEIDPETGFQTEIGAINLQYTIGISFDEEGVLYAWDLVQDSLHIIDPDTLEVETVGPLGININYAQDGDFHKESDTLYLTAYTSSAQLYECDEDTGDCTLIGNLPGIATATAFPYDCYNKPPVTYIRFDPPAPNGCNNWYVSNVTVILNATDDGAVYETYYRINGGDWEVYESPFVISEEGEDILIEYYSVDYWGSAEDVKSATIDIDKIPPEMEVEWDVEKIGWRKWRIIFFITSTDNTSVMDRIEIYLNDALQHTITGPGPTYIWSFVISGDIHFSFKFIASDQACNQAVVIVNSSEINSYPTFKSAIYQTKSLLLLQLLDRFSLIQNVLNILGWYG
jgi:hypothetical protein